MSAMHWEARRRQAALDRKMARTKQSQKACTDTGAKEEHGSQPPGKFQEPEEKPGVRSTADRSCSPPYSAKIDCRYTSLQYSQQW